jgi:hypothetical protein
MSITDTKIIELAQQYLAKLQSENERHFAINKPGVGEDYYDFIDGLDSECGSIQESHMHGYQNKQVEADLDSFLNAEDIKVDRESDDYKLLIDKFLLAAIEACYERLKMYKGEFDFDLSSTKLVIEKPTVKHRPKTIAIQKEVNRIAKDIFEKHKDIRIGSTNLAEEIADILLAEKKIHNPPKFEAIRKNYLDKYPNF